MSLFPFDGPVVEAPASTAGGTSSDQILIMQYVFVGCLTSQLHAGVFQGRICTDNFTCFHTETEVADQT